MKRNSLTKLLSLMVCIVLIAAMALCITGCGDSTPTEQPQSGGQAADTSEPGESTEPDGDGGQADNVLGEGATSFRFSVVDPDGVETEYEIHTDKTIVGEALQELELIDGEEGPYGLYIKTVCGITLDYDADGMYWSFYVNGEYGLTGADETSIEPGALYTLKAEAA